MDPVVIYRVLTDSENAWFLSTEDFDDFECMGEQLKAEDMGLTEKSGVPEWDGVL